MVIKAATALNDGQQKKRKWHSKVRSGCNACKARRIKCDEVHPICAQCERAGKDCVYNAPPPKQDIFELVTGPKFATNLDEQSYAYFVSGGHTLVSTFQWSMSSFWKTMGVCISQDYPAVKHGATAVGAIQGPLHRRPGGEIVTIRRPVMSPLWLMNLAKGMRLASTANPHTVPLEVLLSASCFFMAATIWTDKVGITGLHVGYGLKMIEEYMNGTYEGTVANGRDIEHVYRPMFQRFVVAACAYTDGFPQKFAQLPPNYCLAIDLDNIGYLNRIEEAIEATGTLLKCVIRMRAGAILDGIFARFTRALDEFDEGLTALYLQHLADIHLTGLTGNTFDHDYRHLRMHLSTIRILFATMGPEDDLAYDNYRKEFLFILVECKRLADENLASATAKDTPNLRTSLGTIPPLFFTATKCRDLAIRQSAVEILHSMRIVERGWSSCMATSLARFVIAQEHSQTSSLNSNLLEEVSSGPPLAPVATRRVNLRSVKFSSAHRTATIEYRHCSAPRRKSSAAFSYDSLMHPMSPESMDSIMLQSSSEFLEAGLNPAVNEPQPLPNIDLQSPFYPLAEQSGGLLEIHLDRTRQPDIRRSSDLPTCPPINPPTKLLRTSIPYKPHPSLERDGATQDMADKVLVAFGHTGVVLYTPRIECHCA